MKNNYNSYLLANRMLHDVIEIIDQQKETMERVPLKSPEAIKRLKGAEVYLDFALGNIVGALAEEENCKGPQLMVIEGGLSLKKTNIK